MLSPKTLFDVKKFSLLGTNILANPKVVHLNQWFINVTDNQRHPTRFRRKTDFSASSTY